MINANIECPFFQLWWKDTDMCQISMGNALLKVSCISAKCLKINPGNSISRLFPPVLFYECRKLDSGHTVCSLVPSFPTNPLLSGETGNEATQHVHLQH